MPSPARALVAATLVTVTCAACGRIGFEAIDPQTDAGGPPGMDASSVDARATGDARVDVDAPAPLDGGGTMLDAGVPFDAHGSLDTGVVTIDAGWPDAGPVAAANLVGWWRMDDDPTDGSVIDDSATGNAAMCAPVEGCPPAAAGIFGNAIQLTGAGGGYLVVPHTAAYATTTGFTVSVWVNMAWQRASIVSKLYHHPVDGWRNSWQIESAADGLLSFTVASPSHSYGWTTTTLPAAAWTHLAGTWDGTTRRLYVNGALAFEMTEAVVFDSSDLWFGADYNSGRTLEMTGLMDEVRLYNRALTTAEVGELARRP